MAAWGCSCAEDDLLSVAQLSRRAVHRRGVRLRARPTLARQSRPVHPRRICNARIRRANQPRARSGPADAATVLELGSEGGTWRLRYLAVQQPERLQPGNAAHTGHGLVG